MSIGNPFVEEYLKDIMLKFSRCTAYSSMSLYIGATQSNYSFEFMLYRWTSWYRPSLLEFVTAVGGGESGQE